LSISLVTLPQNESTTAALAQQFERSIACTDRTRLILLKLEHVQSLASTWAVKALAIRRRELCAVARA
jgi:hypothetical protein